MQGALLPIFIFDGVTPVTEKCSYNKMAFLLECLEDLDSQFRDLGGKLYCFKCVSLSL
jgi:deoxyribodipyrimidine photolyase